MNANFLKLTVLIFKYNKMVISYTMYMSLLLILSLIFSPCYPFAAQAYASDRNCVVIEGAAKGQQGPGGSEKNLNFFNNLSYSNGRSLEATLKTSEGTWAAESGEYSDCREISDDICSIKLYIDGDFIANFEGCIPINDCDEDITLLLTLTNSGDPVLESHCTNTCGSDIFDINNFSNNVSPVDEYNIFNFSQEKISLGKIFFN